MDLFTLPQNETETLIIAFQFIYIAEITKKKQDQNCYRKSSKEENNVI